MVQRRCTRIMKFMDGDGDGDGDDDCSCLTLDPRYPVYKLVGIRDFWFDESDL